MFLIRNFSSLIGGGLVCCAAVCGCSGTKTNSGADPPRSEAAIRRFCGDCHTFPEPETYPRDVWADKVREGFNFYYASLRSDLAVPAVDAVERYYAERAPEQLNVAPSPWRMAPLSGSQFAPAESVLPAEPLRAVSFLHVVAEGNTQARSLLICDMRTGQVQQMRASSDGAQTILLAECLNPCHIEPADLDGDGAIDYVVSDLGSFLPEDHDLGAVWFVSRDERNNWMKAPLARELGRVADAQPLDADGDGDLDVIVAEFGWHTTGRILLLRNDPAENGSPRMGVEVIDDRHGTIHVPVTDLNGDGDPDFIALISQEYEVVEAFLNRGDGTFERQRLFQAENPGFGSSGIQLADMDSDGDLDVLYINGDSLDTPIAKPYHGVRWLENDGSYPFAVHEICQLPGAHCVRAGDLDGDGDTDVGVVALLPGAALAEHPAGTFDSILWLEQLEDATFLGHPLERDNCVHAACELWDCDEDGDLDLFVADLMNDPTAERPLTVFLNRTVEGVRPLRVVR